MKVVVIHIQILDVDSLSKTMPSKLEFHQRFQINGAFSSNHKIIEYFTILVDKFKSAIL